MIWDDTERLDAAIRSLPVPEPTPQYWTSYELRLRRRMAGRAGIVGRWIAAAAAVLLAVGLAVVHPRQVPPPSIVVSPSRKAPEPTPLTRFTLAFAEYVRTDDAQARGRLQANLEPLGREQWPHLVRKVNLPDRKAVTAALDLIVRLRVRDSAARLEGCLGEEAWRNEAVLMAIARLALPDSAGVLGRALLDPQRQAIALSACKLLQPRQAVPLIVSAYPRLAPEMRALADMDLLAQATLARPAVTQVLASADDAGWAAFAPLVGDLKIVEAAPRLLRLARTEAHSEVAISGLARMKDPRLLRPILELPDPKALCFLRLAGEPAVAELRRRAIDADPKVALAAVHLLAEFPGRETLQVLRAAIARPATHAASIEALGRVDGAEAAKILVAAFPDSTRKSEIVVAIGRCGLPEMAPWLARAALEPRVRIDMACGVLAGYPRRDVVPVLIAGLESFDRRPRASEILRRLTGERLSPDAGAWERWWKTKG